MQRAAIFYLLLPPEIFSVDVHVIVPCMTRGYASATCCKMLVMRPADMEWSESLSLILYFGLRRNTNISFIIVIFHYKNPFQI